MRRILATSSTPSRVPGGARAPEARVTGARAVRARLRVNNWDLVDASAPRIVGAYLADRDHAPLDRLARSRSVWERRIAMLATSTLIRRGEVATTLRLAERLLQDEHDLIHKAVGWMLREAWPRDPAVAVFVAAHCRTMPRIMLRYAIEKQPPAVRAAYLRGECES